MAKEVAIKIVLDQAESEKKVTLLTAEIAKLNAELKLNKKDLNDSKGANTAAAKAVGEGTIKVKQAQKELRTHTNIVKANTSSLGGLRAANAKLHAEIEGVNTSTKAGQARFKTLSTEINRNQTQINKLDASMKRYQGNVGNYNSALMGLGGSLRGVATAFGFTGIIYAFARALKDGVKTIKDFEKENAVLAGVLNLQVDQIQALTDDARRLGGTYPTLASEVTKLQVSYARLGFTQGEILNLTKDTIEGSLALNSELDATATLIGAVVRSFDDLAATDAKQIIDKLTISTQRTSLSFEKLETSLPKVAGAANAVGISLSPMLAQLGIAQDATQDASIAGTSLRNIYLELAKRGITLNEALGMINNSQSKLTTAYDLFGKRAAITGLALANNIEKIGTLTTEIDNSGGTAERVAKIQMATFQGAVDGMRSSWERLVLSMSGSEGFLTGAVGVFTNLIDSIQTLTESENFGNFIDRLFQFGLSTWSKDAAGNWYKLKTEIQATMDITKKYNDMLQGSSTDELYTLQTLAFQNLQKLKRTGSEDEIKYAQIYLDTIKKNIEDSIIAEKEGIKTKQDEEDLAANKKELAAIIAAEKLNKDLLALRKSNNLISNTELFLLDKQALEENETYILLSEAEKYEALKNLKIKYDLDIDTLNQEQLDKIVAQNEKRKEDKIIEDETDFEALQAEFARDEEETAKHLKNITDLRKEEAEADMRLTEARENFKRQAVAGTFDILNAFVDSNSNMALILFALQKATSIGFVIINAVKEIAAYRAAAAAQIFAASAAFGIFAPAAIAGIKIIEAKNIASARLNAGANVGIIAATAIPQAVSMSKKKYAKGTVLSGPSHADGGIDIYGRDGHYYGEAEGGEPILTAGVSRNPFLLRAASDINVAAGGKPLFGNSGRRFQEGTLLPISSSSSGGLSIDMVKHIVQQAVDGVSSIPVTVLENDMTSMQRRVRIIEKQGDA